LDAKSGGKRGFGAVFGGRADFEGPAFKNLQIAFKWLFLFDSNAFKTLSITRIFPRFRAWKCELKCETGKSCSHFSQITVLYRKTKIMANPRQEI